MNTCKKCVLYIRYIQRGSNVKSFFNNNKQKIFFSSSFIKNDGSKIFFSSSLKHFLFVRVNSIQFQSHHNIMSYTDFKTLETIKSLNDFLKDKSYFDDGYVSIAF